MVKTINDAIDEERKSLAGAALDDEGHKTVAAFIPSPDSGAPLVTRAAAEDYGRHVLDFVAEVDLARQKAADNGSADPPDIDRIGAQLCQLTNALVPLVQEDVLVKPRASDNGGAEPYIVEYDFAGGFLGSLPFHADVEQNREIFVMVRNVRPGYSIGASIDGHAIMHRDMGLIGFSQGALDFTPDAKTATDRPSLDSIDLYKAEVQPVSTQILTLGYLLGGSQYKLSVCAVSGKGDCTTAAPVKAAPAPSGDAGAGDGGAEASGAALPPHLIGVSTIDVHRKAHLGIRAGAGASATIGGYRDTVSEPGIPGTVVRQNGATWSAAVPLLLALYPCGWDSVGMPHGITWGFGLGPDLTRISATPRGYAGMFVDAWDVGLTVAASFERTATLDNPPNSVVNGNAVTDYTLNGGVFVGATTDLDVFDAVFQQLFTKPGVPSVSAAP